MPEEVTVVSLWVLFWLAVGAFVPVLGAMLFVHLGGALDGLVGFRRRRRASRWAAPPGGHSVERLAADLHRLSVHLERVERSDEPHRVARLQAAALAYDAVLLEACRTLEVELPADPAPLPAIGRLETEAALAREGLVW